MNFLKIASIIISTVGSGNLFAIATGESAVFQTLRTSTSKDALFLGGVIVPKRWAEAAAGPLESPVNEALFSEEWKPNSVRKFLVETLEVADRAGARHVTWDFEKERVSRLHEAGFNVIMLSLRDIGSALSWNKVEELSEYVSFLAGKWEGQPSIVILSPQSDEALFSPTRRKWITRGLLISPLVVGLSTAAAYFTTNHLFLPESLAVASLGAALGVNRLSRHASSLEKANATNPFANGLKLSLTGKSIQVTNLNEKPVDPKILLTDGFDFKVLRNLHVENDPFSRYSANIVKESGQEIPSSQEFSGSELHLGGLGHRQLILLPTLEPGAKITVEIKPVNTMSTGDTRVLSHSKIF